MNDIHQERTILERAVVTLARKWGAGWTLLGEPLRAALIKAEAFDILASRALDIGPVDARAMTEAVSAMFADAGGH